MSLFFIGCLCCGHALAGDELYASSYALVIGIDRYPHYTELKTAKNGAKKVASLLRTMGFNVTLLLDEEATRYKIISTLESQFAPRVRKNDRVLVYFAGHGNTIRLGGKDRGYIIPYDGDQTPATQISMATLTDLSDKMGRAKHQLFVMDACYAGLFTVRGVTPKRAAHPGYIDDLATREARQIITAGGANQLVLDDLGDGHSPFTAAFLEGLGQNSADTDRDGYVTFSELAGYMIPRASNTYQTPAMGVLPGHGGGDFIFRTDKTLHQRPLRALDDGGTTRGITTPLPNPPAKRFKLNLSGNRETVTTERLPSGAVFTFHIRSKSRMEVIYLLRCKNDRCDGGRIVKRWWPQDYLDDGKLSWVIKRSGIYYFYVLDQVSLKVKTVQTNKGITRFLFHTGLEVDVSISPGSH